MDDRQFLAARLVAETRRRLAPPSLARIPDTRSPRPLRGRAAVMFARPESASADSGLTHWAARRPRLGLSRPRIDGNYRSTIIRSANRGPPARRPRRARRPIWGSLDGRVGRAAA